MNSIASSNENQKSKNHDESDQDDDCTGNKKPFPVTINPTQLDHSPRKKSALAFASARNRRRSKSLPLHQAT
jgi:hypothetical protein